MLIPNGHRCLILEKQPYKVLFDSDFLAKCQGQAPLCTCNTLFCSEATGGTVSVFFPRNVMLRGPYNILATWERYFLKDIRHFNLYAFSYQLQSFT